MAELLAVIEDPRLADRQLVARCIAGDMSAERALYDAHVDRIYRLMFRMAGEQELAEDFTQENFRRLLANAIFWTAKCAPEKMKK